MTNFFTAATLFPFRSPLRAALRSSLLAAGCVLLLWLLPRAASAQGCVDQGADLGEALLFLQAHAQPDSVRALTSATADPFATRLILINDDNTRTSIQIANVDCGKTSFGTGTQGENRMWVFCKDDTACVQDEAKVDDSEAWQPQGAARNSASYVTQAGDAASTEELSLAFSHVVFLLQQRQSDLQAAEAAPPQQ